MNILKMKSQALCKLISGGFNTGFQKPNMQSKLALEGIELSRMISNNNLTHYNQHILGGGFQTN